MHRSLRSSSMQHGDPRPQDRNSPPYLLQAGRAAIRGRRYGFDPASNERAHVAAKVEVWYGGADGVVPVPIPGLPGRLRGDGTQVDWTRHLDIFSNPPWGNLHPFLELAHLVAQYHRARGTLNWSVQLLLPLRTHRSYWKWAYSADAWCLLKPIAYDGFDEQMPTPCVWLYWGSDVDTFHDVFHTHHGMVLTSFPDFVNLSAMPKQKTEQDKRNDSMLYLLYELAKEADVATISAALQRIFVGRPILELFDFGNDSQFPYHTYGRDKPRYNPETWKVQGKIREAVDQIMKDLQVVKPKPVAKKAAKKTTKPAAKKTAKKATKKSAKPAAKKAAKPAAKKAAKPAAKKAAKPAAKKAGVSAQGKKAPAKKASKKKAPPRQPAKKAAAKPAAKKTDKPADKAGVTPAANSAPAARAGSDKLDLAITAELLPGRKTPFRCKDVSEAFKVSDSTALRSIRRLIEEGKVGVTGDGRSKQYTSLVDSAEGAATA